MATYEIGAFSEQQLLDLGNNGSNIGYGDTFVMPASTDTLIVVTDNDSYLSGDSWSNENANDGSGQNATITTDGEVQTDGNQIYAESYHWVWGSDGCWYIMIEIEAEGDGQDYFSFYGDTPPEGTSMWVECSGNVTCDWINYNDLQDPNNITPPLAVNDAIAINEDETGNLNILDNDVDLDGGSIAVTAVAGGDLGSAFEVTSAEGYAAMVTVYADGTMTVVPGPMFEMLAEGETTSISFDYTITDNDGLTSTATVSVEVNGETTLTALDDAVVVCETEGAGDIDGNVLDNDSIDGVSYTGNVDAVLNDAANVGNWVTGSDGGRIMINADGSYDFDAQGDFDSLKDGESSETTFTYQISENGTVTPQHNILFVFDVSNSTVGIDGGDEFVGTGVGDVNGDGRADTVLDAQIVAAKAVIQDLIDKGIDPANVNIGISTFSGVDTSGASSYNAATVDAQTLGTFSLDDGNLMSTFDSILSGSWTNYEAGLGEAENWFEANADAGEENVMYFLSDGRPITGFDSYGNYVEQSAADYADELAGVESYGTSIHAIGVGANSSLEALDGIDNTGGAVQVLDAESMTAEMLASHDYVAAVDTATITVTVNGKTVFDALNDTMTVSEDETGGDADLLDSGAASVLGNDVEDGAGYTGAVLGVNGDASNVATAVAGSNGGLLTINADGSVDFDANGEFDGLRDDETAVTEFSYEIAGGEMATVTVTVNGDTDYTAVNDTMTVDASEGAGDADLLDGGAASVLANDLDEADAYAGSVLQVNSDAANVAVAVAGSNGGTLTINADGTVDFDAAGDFDNLLDGQTAVTTFTYAIEDGKTASVQVTVNGQTVRDANDDVIEVLASETSGDTELMTDGSDDILDNDTQNGGAYGETVATVNGSVTNVNASVAGSNGGLATINADGTIDFDANGEFDSLLEGEVAETTFTYTIQGGEEATVTVRVTGETEREALDDAITVSESEGADGTDGNVLANDTEEGAAYTGDVLAVNGDAASVAQVVAGSNGGLVTINADGSFDFDANDEFDFLNAGQSADTVFTYEIAGGELANLTVTVEGEDDAAPLPTINVAILMQSSTTMFAEGDSQSLVPDWSDINGDGIANQQIDLSYLMIESFVPDAFADAAAAGYALNISLIEFDDDMGSSSPYVTINNANSVNGQINAKVNNDDSGDYGNAFSNANVFFDDVSSAGDTNVVFFIGNGQQTGAWQTEKDALVAEHNTSVDAYLTDLITDSANANLVNLGLMDDDGFAEQVYAENATATGGFGDATAALSIDEFLI